MPRFPGGRFMRRPSSLRARMARSSRMSTATGLLILPAASGASTWAIARPAWWPRCVNSLKNFCTFVSALHRTKATFPSLKNSIKIARAYTKGPAVICFEDAFHGRTLLTMSLTSKTHPYKAGFEPFASDIYRIPFAYPYRSAQGASAATFAHHMEDAFQRIVAPESVAAVIAEPVLGEGGFAVPPLDHFRLITET